MRPPQTFCQQFTFRGLTPTSTLSVESATEAQSALRTNQKKTDSFEQIRKRGFVGRNETAPGHFPTQAFRGLTPTFSFRRSPQRKRIPPYEKFSLLLGGTRDKSGQVGTACGG